jgi:hypothetical protein
MHEKCDGCGAEFPVLGIVFTGRQYLCPDCVAQKAPFAMGTLRRF